MGWADTDAMRRYNGLPLENSDPNYESDGVLDYYLSQAEYAVRPDVMTLVRDDQMSGNINGSNTEFYLSRYPISDQNFDKSINFHDVTCYGWGDLDNFLTKTSIATTSINSREGRVVLTSAPSSTFEAITCDYYYSLYEIDFNLLELATAYLAGWTYFTARYMEVPSNVRIGAQAYRMESPAEKAWMAYLRTMSRIKTELISSSSRKGIRLNRPY